MAVLVAGNRERGGTGSGVGVLLAPMVPTPGDDMDDMRGNEAREMAR